MDEFLIYSVAPSYSTPSLTFVSPSPLHSHLSLRPLHQSYVCIPSINSVSLLCNVRSRHHAYRYVSSIPPSKIKKGAHNESYSTRARCSSRLVTRTVREESEPKTKDTHTTLIFVCCVLVRPVSCSSLALIWSRLFLSFFLWLSPKLKDSIPIHSSSTSFFIFCQLNHGPCECPSQCMHYIFFLYPLSFGFSLSLHFPFLPFLRSQISFFGLDGWWCVACRIFIMIIQMTRSHWYFGNDMGAIKTRRM